MSGHHAVISSEVLGACVQMTCPGMLPGNAVAVSRTVWPVDCKSTA